MKDIDHKLSREIVSTAKTHESNMQKTGIIRADVDIKHTGIC